MWIYMAHKFTFDKALKAHIGIHYKLLYNIFVFI